MCCLCMITVMLLIGENRKRNWKRKREEMFDVDYACIKNIVLNEKTIYSLQMHETMEGP